MNKLELKKKIYEILHWTVPEQSYIQGVIDVNLNTTKKQIEIKEENDTKTITKTEP